VDFGTAVRCEPGAFLSAHAGVAAETMVSRSLFPQQQQVCVNATLTRWYEVVQDRLCMQHRRC